MHSAPSSAASSMSGRDVRSRYQRLFRKLVAVNMAAEVQDPSAPEEDSLATAGNLLVGAVKRGSTRNSRTKVSPIFSTASCTGNRLKSTASTTMLSVGEVSIVASADSWLDPES